MDDAQLNIIRKLISENRIKKAIETELIPNLSNQSDIDEALLFLSRLKDIEEEERNGTIDYSESSKEVNKIRKSLLEFLTNIGKAVSSNSSKYKPQFDKNQVEQLVKSLNGSIKFYFFFSSILFILGIVILSIGFLFEDDKFSIAMNIGGGFISSLSGLPIREIILKRERVSVFKIIMLKIEQLTQGNLNIAEAKKVDELIWQIIEKRVLS